MIIQEHVNAVGIKSTWYNDETEAKDALAFIPTANRGTWTFETPLQTSPGSGRSAGIWRVDQKLND